MPALEGLSAPHGVLFDAGGTLVQLDARRLTSALQEAGHDPACVDTAFWQTLVLLDSEFSPDRGAFDDWWTDWQARFATHCQVPTETFRQIYDALNAHELLWQQPVPDAAAALDRLRAAGVAVGVVSNADGRIAQALQAAGLADRCDVIVDSTLVGVHKPDPAIFQHALEPLGLDPAHTWYLGDSVAYDAAAADAAGLVSWIVDHRGLHAHDHPRRVGSLTEFADAVLAARGIT